MEMLEFKKTLDLDDPDDVDWLYKWAQSAHEEMLRLKKLLWLRHGCSIAGLYGDDGEMQCGNCMIDFKRMSAQEIEDKFILNNKITLMSDDEKMDALKKLFPESFKDDKTDGA